MTAKKPAHGVRFIREGGEARDEFGAHSRLADALARALTDTIEEEALLDGVRAELERLYSWQASPSEGMVDRMLAAL